MRCKLTNHTALSNSHDGLCRTIHIVIVLPKWERRTLLYNFLCKVFVHRSPDFTTLKERGYRVYSNMFIISSAWSKVNYGDIHLSKFVGQR